MPSAHSGVRLSVEANDERGARGSCWACLEERALLPGAAVLARLGHHTCHFYRHHNKEPPVGCDALEMVAGVCVLSAAGRPVDGGADRGFRGHVR